MCGIAYVRRLDGRSPERQIIKRYNKQKSRGSEGFGFITLKEGRITKYARAATEAKILEDLKDQPADEIIFHHRFPTSTPNFAEAAHPIFVSHPTLKYDYYLIHNGIITNDAELKRDHEERGFRYNTELTCQWKNTGKTINSYRQWNDSEALAIELALTLESGKTSLEQVKGTVAFICLQTKKNSARATKLFYGRNYGSPLKIKTDDTHISITSEGNGDIVEAHKLNTIDYLTNTIESTDFKIGDSFTYNYAHQRNRKESWWEGFEDPSDYAIAALPFPSHKRSIGFQAISKKLPVIGKSSTEEENDYLELCIEYENIQKQIAKIVDKDTSEAQYLEERRLDLEVEMKAYDGKKFSNALGLI